MMTSWRAALLTAAAVIVAAGGFSVGSAKHVSSEQADTAGERTRLAAFARSEQAAYARASASGEASGRVSGRRSGERSGERAGRVAAKRVLRQRAAAAARRRERELEAERRAAAARAAAAAAETAERTRNCGAPLFVEGYCPTDDEIAQENSAEALCGPGTAEGRAEALREGIQC